MEGSWKDYGRLRHIYGERASIAFHSPVGPLIECFHSGEESFDRKKKKKAMEARMEEKTRTDVVFFLSFFMNIY